MSGEEERLWRAYLLGAYGQKLTLDTLMKAVASDVAFDRALESREERLERELVAERRALAGLRQSPVLGRAVEPPTPAVEWLWEA